VHILNGQLRIITEVFAQAADEDIQATAIEIIILSPDIFQDVRTTDDLVRSLREVIQDICFTLGQTFGLSIQAKIQVGIIK